VVVPNKAYQKTVFEITLQVLLNLSHQTPSVLNFQYECISHALKVQRFASENSWK